MSVFFDDLEHWKKDWKDMPEFIQEEVSHYRAIKILFDNEEDIKVFSELLKQPIYKKTKFLWFPKKEKLNLTKHLCVDEDNES